MKDKQRLEWMYSLIFAHQIYSMLKAQKNSKMTLLNQRAFAEYMDVKEFFLKS